MTPPMPKPFAKCGKCKAEVRERSTVACGGCGRKMRVCEGCRPTFITCGSEECVAKHRESMKSWGGCPYGPPIACES